MEFTAETVSVKPLSTLAVTRLVNNGTNTATPRGAARSLKSPYVPVPEPAVSFGTPDRTAFIKIVALPPNPNPKIPSEAASNTTEESVVNNSISAQPIPVRVSEPVSTYLGSYLSASGPIKTEPKAIPIYIIEIA